MNLGELGIGRVKKGDIFRVFMGTKKCSVNG